MVFTIARANEVDRLQVPNEELRTLLYRIPRLTPKLFNQIIFCYLWIRHPLLLLLSTLRLVN